MNRDYLAEFEASLFGRPCLITRRVYEEPEDPPGPPNWDFLLGEGTGFSSNGDPWRIVADGRIALTDADHGHAFGLPQAIDGEAVARALLGTQRILRVIVDRQTADLALHFDGGARLDVFRNSAGYEGWHAWYLFNGSRWEAIGAGGGDVVFFNPDPGAQVVRPVASAREGEF